MGIHEILWWWFKVMRTDKIRQILQQCATMPARENASGPAFSCHLQSSFGFLSQRESDRAARTMVWRSFLIVTSYNIVSFIACCNLIDVLCVIVIYWYIIIYIYIYMYIYDYLSCILMSCLHGLWLCGFVLYKYRPSSPVKHLILSFGAGWKTSSWNTATCLSEEFWHSSHQIWRRMHF